MLRRIRGVSWRHGVIAVSPTGPAPSDSPNGQPTALEGAMAVQCLERVLGTGRLESAVSPDPGAADQPIGVDWQGQDLGQEPQDLGFRG